MAVALALNWCEMKLKPCPFCGGYVHHDQTEYPQKSFVGSIVCSRCGHFDMTPKEFNMRDGTERNGFLAELIMLAGILLFMGTVWTQFKWVNKRIDMLESKWGQMASGETNNDEVKR